MKKFEKLIDILINYEKNHQKDDMLAIREGSKWKTLSTKSVVTSVNNISKGLISKGIKKGDRIGLMSGNRPEWNIIDFAVNQIGAAVVPLYPTLSSKDIGYILEDAEVKIIFISNIELFEKVRQAIASELSAIEIYLIDPHSSKADVEHLSVIEKMGESADVDLESYRKEVSPDDLLTLIYTSGTTGTPKGVVLSHHNILCNISACNHLIPEGLEQALSFLPLSHIFERMVVYLYLSRGLKISYTENLDNVVQDINEVKPQVFTTVPRVLEKVYDKIIDKGKALTGIKKTLFFWAVNLGHKYKEPEKNGAIYNLKLAIARKLIFSKWREALGGNVKIIVSGGAALQERLSRIFWAADLKVLEGYGLTETSPVIAVNSWKIGDVKFGSVGRVLDNLEVKIAKDGEILVKGPSITRGYYKNQAATDEAIDKDGFFHTGDIGELTKDGFLRITDRKKEIFKTAGGKYIAPQPIENKLMESPLIAQVMVVGENRRFPTALIVPNFEELQKRSNFEIDNEEARKKITQKEDVIDIYEKILQKTMANFGQWEKVKKFALLPNQWTIDNGELTPKLSLRRKVILEKNEDILEKLYESENPQ